MPRYTHSNYYRRKVLIIKALQDVSICSSRNMRSVFTKAGFKALTDSKYLTGTKYLLPGDILLYEGHHAATNITLGSAVRGSWNPATSSVSPSDAEPASDKEEKAGSMVEILDSVNIRLGPDITYKSVGVAKAGDRLPYMGFTFPNGWLLVEHSGQLCAVSGKYARVVG